MDVHDSGEYFQVFDRKKTIYLKVLNNGMKFKLEGSIKHNKIHIDSEAEVLKFEAKRKENKKKVKV